MKNVMSKVIQHSNNFHYSTFLYPAAKLGLGADDT